MHVAFITDRNGFEGAELAVRSVVKTSHPETIHVVDAGMDETQCERLRALSETVRIVPVNSQVDEWLSDFALHGEAHVQPAAYLKLQLHRLLEDIDRVLYLDIDILTLQSITPLFDVDLGNALVGATWNISQRDSGHERLGLNNHYFSSAVMLCPLTKWRDEQIEERFKTWYEANHERMQYNDQEVLNGCFNNRIRWIDKRWNVSHWEILRHHNQVGLPPSDCRIVHFNGPIKPWHSNYEREVVLNQEAYKGIAAHLSELSMESARFEASLNNDLQPTERAPSGRFKQPRVAITVTCDPLRLHLLPQFVQHYRAYGVDDFYISLHFDVGYAEDEKTGHLSRANEILKPLGLEIFSSYSCLFTAAAIRAHHDRIISRIASHTRWIVPADLDEFHEFPDELHTLASFMDRHGIGYVRGRFVDRLARQGFPDFQESESIWKQYPIGTDMTRSVVGGWVDKVMLAHAGVSLRPGHHATTPQESARALGDVFAVHHFKWDSTVVERLKRRLLDDWKKTCPWWTQSDQALSWIEGVGSEGLAGLRVFDFQDDMAQDLGGPHSTNTRYRAKSAPRNHWLGQLQATT